MGKARGKKLISSNHMERNVRNRKETPGSKYLSDEETEVSGDQ